MLSPLDAEVVATWGDRGVPFEVVARGIERGVEKSMWHARPDNKPSFSLRSCRPQVDREIRKFLDRAGSTGTSEPVEPLEVIRHRKLCRALKKLGKQEGWAPIVDRILPGLATDLPTTLAQAERQEERIYLSLLRGLSYPQRLQLIRDARQTSGSDLPMSRRVRRRARRFHYAALLRARFGVPEFW